MASLAVPAPFVRSFAFPENDQHVSGGCAVVVARGRELGGCVANRDDSEDFTWSAEQTAAFLAGEPLTLAWVSPAHGQSESEGAYVCCWVTIDSD
jgi:hypothetical protein